MGHNDKRSIPEPTEKKIKKNAIKYENTINASWKNETIKEVVIDALGKRNIDTPKRTSNKTPWFYKEVKVQYRKEKRAYLKYRTMQTPEADEEYKLIRNDTNIIVR